VCGKKWRKFNSDKVCTLSYANIQGKQALIEKFRNSAVMDEDPSFRPKMFYSEGPRKGEEEPFPPMTVAGRQRGTQAPSTASRRAFKVRSSTLSWIRRKPLT
jgi:hypothetical protein